ncbi:MAG: GNAT family N-acetyltransferase [Candidatus Helarchaeota archaeon]
MDIEFRSYENEDDIPQIVKVHKTAFWNGNFSSYMDENYWKWKYHTKRPNYDPEGYFLATYKKRVIATIICTIREMNFFGNTYRVACIDDVATLPKFRRRGISQELLNRAFIYMNEKNVDLSMLIADPSYHAHRFYNKNGFDYVTKCRVAFKIIDPSNMVKKLKMTLPLAGPVYLFEKLNEYRHSKRCKLPIKFYILNKNNEEFLRVLNENYKDFISFEKFSNEYWTWFRHERPEKFENIVVSAVLDGKIIGGGTLTKSYYLIIDTQKPIPFYVLSELFVDKQYRRKRVASEIYKVLEKIAINNGVGFLISFWNQNHYNFRTFLSKNGFLLPSISDVEMIKPISDDFKNIFHEVKNIKKPWHVALEQSGF